MAGNIDETSYDIFEWFPILVCQNIFEHLDGKAVIQASRVNKEWNKLCTESQQVEKLKLVFNHDDDEEKTLRKIREAVDVLQNSKRQYQSIELYGTSSAAARLFLPFLADRAGSWKAVKFQDCKFDHQMWLEMLRIIEPSVAKLSIADCDLSEQINNDINWNFPCLRSLEVDASDNMLRHFVRCTNLVKFHCQFWRRGNPIEVLRTLLRNNHKLEELALRTDATLFDNPSEFRFKLKKFNIELNGLPAPEILQSFLETQSQTLENLKVKDAKLNQASLELILRMPKLSSLKTSVWDIKDAILNWNQEFPVNTTITSLQLGSISFELNLDAGLATPLENFIRALRNLKHFKCYKIDDEGLLLLARAAPALESLETRWFLVTRFPEGEIFPNITNFKAGSFHRNFQEPTGDSKFAKLVRERIQIATEDMPVPIEMNQIFRVISIQPLPSTKFL